MTEKRGELAGTLAHGEQTLPGKSESLSPPTPKLLLLDEPTAGMSPEETIQTGEFIKSLADPLTIVLVEHDMDVVLGISDKITVLHNGAFLAEGTVEEVRAKRRSASAYT